MQLFTGLNQFSQAWQTLLIFKLLISLQFLQYSVCCDMYDIRYLDLYYEYYENIVNCMVIIGILI